MPKEKQITVPEYADLMGFSVKKVYAMIDDKKIKSAKKVKRTMVVL